MTLDNRTVLSPEVAKAAFAEHGTYTKAAKVLGVHEASVRRACKRASAELVAAELPTDADTLEELLDARSKAFTSKQRLHDLRYERVVFIPIEGPIGILHLGDPHIDDDGCDLPLLRRHVELVSETEGLYGATVGDMTNNWVGRLGRLYAHQRTTAKDAWRLAEWLVDSMSWLYIVRGNHDAWSGDGDPLDWITRNRVPVDAAHDARIKLVWADGSEARIWARHDFPGRSQWAKSHGQAKAAVIGGYPADVLISGHRHQWEHRTTERAGGSVFHAVQVGSYKRQDEYAAQLGFPETHHGAAVLTIIDPSKHGPGRVRVEWDIESGVEFLKWLRAQNRK